eukprot:TRINITY_DN58265_c0_g1_i1.p1 TRINITY_DN58265_c0_g1~~TRINITY_DN58265_c0_g1_i1.p1  ORF type:complete len:152 (+),score=36.42 TRINITY_DN58265_c0_g1_i1:54-509(+)
MARYFSESKIEEFKECFDFHARREFITHEGDLSIIMRSLSYSPTREEVTKYFSKHRTPEGQLDFASVLDVLHEHCGVENCQTELQAALAAQDRGRSGHVSTSDVRHILTSLGEKLSRNEVDTLFREAGISSSGQVKISDFVQTIMTPSPDY